MGSLAADEIDECVPIPAGAEQRHDDILLLATRYGRSTAGATAAGAQASHLTSTKADPSQKITAGPIYFLGAGYDTRA